MTSRTGALVALPLSLLLVAAALTGCSAATTSPASSSHAASDPAPATHPAGAPTSGDGLCALVSVNQANAAVKAATPFTEQESGSFVDGEPECGYSAGSDLSFAVNVTVWNLAKTPMDLSGDVWVCSGGYQRTIDLPGGTAGVGSCELDAVLGSTGLSVESLGSTDLSQDQLIALAKLFAPLVK